MTTHTRSHSSKRNKIVIAGIILFVLFTLVISMYAGMKHKQTQTEQPPLSQMNNDALSATVLTQPRPLPESFQLVTDENQTFTNQQLKGQWSLLFFGFTNCPHICPMALNDLNTVYELLSESGTNNLPQIMLITVDPERDTIEQMHTYVKAFNPTFMGVTGEKSELDKLVSGTGSVYMKQPGAKEDHYDVPHSDAIILINPDGDIAAFFTSPHDARVIAEEYQLITG